MIVTTYAHKRVTKESGGAGGERGHHLIMRNLERSLGTITTQTRTASVPVLLSISNESK